MMKQRGLSGRLLGAFSLAALMAAGCSGGLGDGVVLDSIDIRTANGTLDDMGNATGDDLTIGRCIIAPLSFVATYSDGEVVAFAERAKWTSSNPDVIAIINSRETDDNLNRQFPLAIATSSAPVTLTANFAGRSDSVSVTVVDSELVIEPLERTFAVGVDTPLSARQLVGGVQTILRTGLVNWTSSNSALEIGSVDSDNDLGFGIMSAAVAANAEIAAELDLTLGGIDLKDFFLDDGSTLGTVCEETVTTNVQAKVPTSYEIVPRFVSPNSGNQSSLNSLFLASGTSADVDVEAVFDNDQRQNVNANVVWTYTDADQAIADENDADDDDDNDVALLPLPSPQGGRIRAGLDDHNVGGDGNQQLIAIVRLGDDLDTSTNRGDDDLDDAETTLDVMVDDYADSEIQLLLKPADNGRFAFSALSSYTITGLFGNPDVDQESAELVLDLTEGNLFYVGETVPDSDDEDVVILFAPSQGNIAVATKPIVDEDDEVDEDALEFADSQTLEFELRGDIAEGETTGVVRASTASPSFVLAEADVNMLEDDDDFVIAFDGETTEAAGEICLELGQTLDLNTLILFGDEADGPVQPAIVSESSVWTVPVGGTSVTVRNDTNLRGRITVVDTAVNSVTVQADYVNNKEDDGDDDQITRMDTLQFMAMPVGDCPDPDMDQGEEQN